MPRWLMVRRPNDPGELYRAHLPPLLVVAIVLLVAAWVPLERMPVWPCAFLSWTGYPCPLCGGVRCFSRLAQGAWGDGTRESPLAAVLYVLAWAVLLWNAAALITRRRWMPGRLIDPERWARPALAALLLGLLGANWIYRLACGLK